MIKNLITRRCFLTVNCELNFSQPQPRKMQETVTNTNERKSLFSSFMEVLEARDRQAQADRQLQEEKYMRRTQRIYDFHG